MKAKDRSAILGKHVATELGVTFNNVRRHFRRGTLTGFETGKVLWIYADSLEAFKAQRPRPGRPTGLLSTTPPKNRALNSKYFRGTKKRKTKADKLAAAEEERRYQREYHRKRRATKTPAD